MGNFFYNIFKYSKIISNRKTAILSGGLVFFSLLELVPLAYLISLLVSVFGTQIDLHSNLLVAKQFESVTSYVFETATKLGASGNIIALIITTYSATNLFFHLRRTGEIVYNYSSKNNLFTRVISFLAMFVLLVSFVFFQSIYIFISKLSIFFLGSVFGRILNYTAILFSLLIFICILNLYACPYKVRIKDVFIGSLYTCVFSIVMTIGFLIYVNYFASYTEIYGKITIIVVFLLWLNIIMKGLIGGMNLNVYFLGKRRKRKIFNKMIKLE